MLLKHFFSLSLSLSFRAVHCVYEFRYCARLGRHAADSFVYVVGGGVDHRLVCVHVGGVPVPAASYRSQSARGVSAASRARTHGKDSTARDGGGETASGTAGCDLVQNTVRVKKKKNASPSLREKKKTEATKLYSRFPSVDDLRNKVTDIRKRVWRGRKTGSFIVLYSLVGWPLSAFITLHCCSLTFLSGSSKNDITEAFSLRSYLWLSRSVIATSRQTTLFKFR